MALVAWLFSFFIASAPAQVLFKFESKPGKPNWRDCKGNQAIIYQAYMNKLDSQILRLLRGLSSEVKYDDSPELIDAFSGQILEHTLERTVVEHYAQRLAAHQFTSTMELVFGDDLPSLTLEQLMTNTVFHTARLVTSSGELKQFVALRLRKYLANTVAGRITAHTVGRLTEKSVLNSLIRGAALRSLGRNFTMQALKGVSVRLGKDIALRSVTGLWTLITIPLSGSALPEETKWTDLLSKHEQLMLNPELMREAKIGYGAPWYVHCNALERRRTFMQSDLNDLLKKKENRFQQLALSLDDRSWLDVPATDPYAFSLRPAVDNTYVSHRPFIRPRPEWAIE